MKKIFLFSLMLLSALTFVACSDKDDSRPDNVPDRLPRPMFRDDNNTGKGSSDPYNCVVVDINKVHLYWYLVNEAVGYEVKWAVQPYVANGREAWEDTENGVDGKQLSGHVVIKDPQTYDLLIEHLSYQTGYRFAIRALHSFDQDANGKYNDPKNSDWYGYGNGREWADYLHRETGARYAVPTIIQVSDITKTTMRVNLTRAVNENDVNYNEYIKHFQITQDKAGNNVWKIDRMTFKASASTPTATVDEQFRDYKLTDADWERGYIEVTGLSENAVYNIDVWDDDIKVNVDANFNPLMKRTKGDPGEPILIKHIANPKDTTGVGTADEKTYDISKYNAMMIDPIIESYNRSLELAENQVFYLEGGKAYYCRGSISLYKGLTIQTNPEDIEAGKPRAILYMQGLRQDGTSVATCNFMLGRNPEAGENSAIPLDIEDIKFKDLDVQCPLAGNYGTNEEKIAAASGNYFMNMYSGGMGINVTSLEWDGCTFQGLNRGFFRIQGSNDFNIHKIRLTNCEFYNGGYYDLNSAGYCWIFADHNGKPKSNILEDVEVSECVFYDCAHGSLITDNNRNITWDESVRWNINVHHNTFVNFQTEKAASPIINTRYNPAGSYLSFHDNLIIVTADPEDVGRPLNSAGWDTRNIQGGDGTGVVTFDIYNNWSTNDNLNNGQVFKASAFNATSNAPGKFLKSCIYPAGGKGTDQAGVVSDDAKYELEVHADDISAVDLMMSPNPKNFINESARKGKDHHTDTGIDGLYYKQTDAVKNSNIYKKEVGAKKLREGK